MARRPVTPPATANAPAIVTPAVTATTAAVHVSARAQRPIGIFYDELSRGVNPFSLIESCGIAEASDDPATVAELFDRFGIVKIRGAYSREESRELTQHCISFSGLQPLDFRDVFSKKRKWGTGGAPVLHDSRFWPYVVNPAVKNSVQAILGDNVFEFGSAVAAHYSARGLHRDYRMLVESEDSEYFFKRPTKRIIRVLHYCGTHGGALGYIPFSHNETEYWAQGKRVGLERSTEWFDRHRDVLTQARLQRNFLEADEIERHVCWVNADPGDVIISNSAMLHCGEYLTGPRYFFVSTYAQSDVDTLPLAAKNAVTPLSSSYYGFLLENGLGGSADVLAEVALRAR